MNNIDRDGIRHRILKYTNRCPKEIREYAFIDVFDIVEDILEELGFKQNNQYSNTRILGNGALSEPFDKKNILWKK